MKTMALITLLGLAAGSFGIQQLNEDSILELLKTRDVAMVKGDAETVVGLYTTNAVISVSFLAMPADTEEIDVQEFTSEMEFVGFKTRPIKIEFTPGGAEVGAETSFSIQPPDTQDRPFTMRVEETLKITLDGGAPKIAGAQFAIVGQMRVPDELSERIMKLVRQEGGIDKETAIKLLEESGCKYKEGDGKRKKTSIQAGMQCGDEIAALATCIPGLESLQLMPSAISDDGLADIGKIQTLETLYLMGTGITDAGIEHLANLTRLELLSLMATGITDASLKRFADFPALKTLYITGAPGVTDAGLFHLAKVETLESLTLTINMTDDGLAHLAKVPNLGYLRVKDVPITDASLVYVEQMKKLTAITLNNTEVTYKGAKQLKEKRPKLNINPKSLVEPCEDARRNIEYAKKKWAEKENKKEGATPTREELDPLLKRFGGFDALTCEDGGTLTINPIGTGAECSIHGKTKARKPATPMKGLSKEDFDVDGAKAGRWTMDLDAAKKLAVEKQLPILLNFTGSDWCYWCKLMEKNVFTQPEWSAYATNHIVMVLIDYPRDKTAVPDKYKERNNVLKEQYGIRGYPTFVLLKPDGQTELARLKAGRDKTPASFIKELEPLLNTEEVQ